MNFSDFLAEYTEYCTALMGISILSGWQVRIREKVDVNIGFQEASILDLDLEIRETGLHFDI